MRDIGIDIKPSAMPANTFLAYGDTRTGKTKFGATFPRPFTIVDVGERGYETIQTMDRSEWWEPDVAPIIVGIDTMADFAAIVERIKPLVASGRVLSVVFDAFTFYCDFYLAQLNAIMPGGDTRQIYGKLGTHLQYVRNSLHQLPVNVVWNCLAAAPESGDNGTTTKMGGPLIPGSQGPKFAAAVNYLFYSKLVQKRAAGEITEERYEIHTKQFGLYAAGNRLGASGTLPNPFMGGTYEALLPYLGYDPADVRKAMKPIGSIAKPITATPIAAKPPITNGRPTVVTVTPRSAPKALSPTGK